MRRVHRGTAEDLLLLCWTVWSSTSLEVGVWLWSKRNCFAPSYTKISGSILNQCKDDALKTRFVTWTSAIFVFQLKIDVHAFLFLPSICMSVAKPLTHTESEFIFFNLSFSLKCLYTKYEGFSFSVRLIMQCFNVLLFSGWLHTCKTRTSCECVTTTKTRM